MIDQTEKQPTFKVSKSKIPNFISVLFICSVLLNLVLAVSLLKHKPTSSPTPTSRKQTSQPTTQTTSNNKVVSKEKTYIGYFVESYPSPDNVWSVELQYLNDFNDKCLAKINVYGPQGGPLSYPFDSRGKPLINGWIGNYTFSCIYTPLMEGKTWQSNFSGWAENGQTFFFPSYDKQEIFYGYLEDNKWFIRGIDTIGKVQASSKNLDFLLAAQPVTDQSNSQVVRTYKSNGELTGSKTIDAVSYVRYIEVEDSNLVVILAPQTYDEESGKQQVNLYLVDMETGYFSAPVTAGRTLRAGPPCLPGSAVIDNGGRVNVDGECLNEMIVLSSDLSN